MYNKIYVQITEKKQLIVPMWKFESKFKESKIKKISEFFINVF